MDVYRQAVRDMGSVYLNYIDRGIAALFCFYQNHPSLLELHASPGTSNPSAINSWTEHGHRNY